MISTQKFLIALEVKNRLKSIKNLKKSEKDGFDFSEGINKRKEAIKNCLIKGGFKNQKEALEYIK